jgi:NADH-quinone oxidoreductase subunit I
VPETSFLADTWQLVRAVGRAMGVTLRNLFRTPVTVQYPTVKRVYPDRFRGILALTYDRETGEENCIGCRLCEYICPPQVIKVEMLKAEKRNFAKTFTLELYSCEFCELCVQVCPTDAIVMLRTFDLATADRRELLLDKDRLHALGLQHEPSWATGTRLRDMQAPPKAARAEGKAEGKAEPATPVARPAAGGTTEPREPAE